MTVRSHWGRVMSLPDLVAELRGHAGGIYTYRAAVELVVDHDVFLGRSAFRDEFVRFVRGGAYVRWGAVVTALNQHRLLCSSSEQPMRATVKCLPCGVGARAVDPAVLIRRVRTVDSGSKA